MRGVNKTLNRTIEIGHAGDFAGDPGLDVLLARGALALVEEVDHKRRVADFGRAAQDLPAIHHDGLDLFASVQPFGRVYGRAPALPPF